MTYLVFVYRLGNRGVVHGSLKREKKEGEIVIKTRERERREYSAVQSIFHSGRRKREREGSVCLRNYFETQRPGMPRHPPLLLPRQKCGQALLLLFRFRKRYNKISLTGKFFFGSNSVCPFLSFPLFSFFLPLKFSNWR